MNFTKHVDFSPIRLNRIGLFQNRCRSTPSAMRLAAMLVCLSAALSGEARASTATVGSDRSTVPAPADDGFTRESMAALGRPEPAPAPVGPVVSPRVVRSEVDSKDFVPHHSKVRHAPRVHNAPRLAVRIHPRRKNPVVGFVFWWNGWVIKTFHTKFGTVLLGTVGAKA